MGKAAKKSDRRRQADQPVTKSGGSTELSADAGDTTASVPAPRPSAEPSPHEVAEHTRLQLLADTAGRVFRSLSRWLEHDKPHVQVLGWIVCLVLLGVAASVVLVPLLRWEPWQVILFFLGGTGATAGADVIRGVLRKRK